MKLAKTLNNKNIQSTGKVTAMKLNENAAAMVFSVFTSNVYSDPIGTVIREIASNCFDAHVEAGTDSTKNPVVVRLNKELADGHSISFIDKGVGMSPDRVYNIYGTYFESTKNETNDQIGGFGIGGKTPLAYAESFFVITRHDGIEYTYNIFEGNDSPMIELMSQESTKQRNGTEVRVPIKSGDVDKFEKKIVRQLFYFENIIFEGFSDYYVTNEYTITKGKTFLYRNSDYSGKMHVCLGKVAYPIDFDAMELDSSDYRIPVAVKIEIGELEDNGVNISREALKYTTKNIKILIKKMDAVKAELTQMLAKQHDNVHTLKNYYDVIDDINTLNLDGDREIYVGGIDKNDVNFPNFKYSDLKLPNYDNLVSEFYGVKTFGKRESTRYHSRRYQNNFNSMADFNNVYYVNEEFKRVVLKQSYLQFQSDRFFLHTPTKFGETAMAILKKELGVTTSKEIPFTKKQIDKAKKAHGKLGLDVAYFDDTALFKTKIINVIPKVKGEKLIAELIKDVHVMMVKGAKNYDKVVVPDDYVAMRKANRMSASVLKTGIPVKDKGNYGYRSKMTMEEFVNLKGKIYYGFADDDHTLESSSRIFQDISGSDNQASVSYYGENDKKGTMFIQISKGNEKYLKMLDKKAIHVDYFYQTYVSRKINMILENKANEKAESLFDENVLPVFSRDIFEKIDNEIHEKAVKVRESLEKHRDFYHIYAHHVMNKLNIDIDNVQVDFKHKEELEYLTKITDGCRDRLKWINFPHEIDLRNKADKELIEMVNLCIDK